MKQTIKQTIRNFMLVEAITFFIAALIHSGLLSPGYEHYHARIAESVLATILGVTVVLTCIWPAWTRKAALFAQALALLGTLVGVFTIAVGIGPRTLPDIVYHVAIVAVLVWGLVMTKRAPADDGVPDNPASIDKEEDVVLDAWRQRRK